MCNPRRIRIRATRQIAQSWEREVQRRIQLTTLVQGEARARQALGNSVAPAVLMALQRLLEQGADGWQRVETGFRFSVAGGYAQYSPEEQTLEIVALAQGQADGMGEAVRRLQGTVEAAITQSAEGRYYDDGWGGHTRERARKEANEAAQRQLDVAAAERLRQEADAAEAAEHGALQEQATQAAQDELNRNATALRRVLDQKAAQELAEVGAEARMAFNQLMAHAYRDALVAMARARGASNVTCHEQDGVMDIEFMMPG